MVNPSQSGYSCQIQIIKIMTGRIFHWTGETVAGNGTIDYGGIYFFQDIVVQLHLGHNPGPELVEEIVKAAESMSEKKIGALIVIARQSTLASYTEEGQIIDARISAHLLESIFFKNSPLHDGAVLIENNLIHAARCPLPVTDQFRLPSRLGMRHRAAIGMSEHTDALVVVGSEETRRISVAESGRLRENFRPNELRNIFLVEKVW